ncbi:hypothetical protein [Lutimonas sp.]|uniref:hypothetical protein n=1 Tax=Lutimonas sp. TaxID=1872403 RepID=UPI003C71209D
MPKIFIAFLLLTLFLFACKNKEQKTEEQNDSIPMESSMIKSEKPIIRLNSKSEELVATWAEYQKFDELITQYQEISMNEALLNSVELSELALQLRDSIRVEKLDLPEVKIRLNVLYSETLRLADMSTIPTITEALVAQENNNVIDAYSALNLKINNMSSQDQLNEEISKFVDEVLDEPKRDSLDIKDEDNQDN